MCQRNPFAVPEWFDSRAFSQSLGALLTFKINIHVVRCISFFQGKEEEKKVARWGSAVALTFPLGAMVNLSKSGAAGTGWVGAGGPGKGQTRHSHTGTGTPS